MSVHVIFYKDGAKVMRPIPTREEYLALRGTEKQKAILKAVREGDERQKHRLLQMNYSCLPNEDGTLKGSTRMSTSVGMDIDHVTAEEMVPMKERILAKKNELGLLMLEVSARKQGYHLVFRRHPELSQEENLRWASELLGVAFDDKAKDITRVFFTTSDAEEDLLYLDDKLFEIETASNPKTPNPSFGYPSPVEGEGDSKEPEKEVYKEGAQKPHEQNKVTNSFPLHVECRRDRRSEGGRQRMPAGQERGCCDSMLDYNGLPYSAIIRKWWELYNEGKEPVKTNRDVLTFELAVNLRHICGFDRELMDSIIPCYDGFSETQKMKCIDSALSEKRTQMPKRLKEVLFEVRRERMNEGGDTVGGEGLDEAVLEDERFYYNRLPRMPQGVR